MDITPYAVVVIVVSVGLATLISIVGLVLRFQLLETRVELLGLRTAECNHCWHWMMSNPRGLRTYQHCCWCGAVVAVFGKERIPSARKHGTYLIHAPGLEVVDTDDVPVVRGDEVPRGA